MWHRTQHESTVNEITGVTREVEIEEVALDEANEGTDERK